jgi:LysM repeat protein
LSGLKSKNNRQAGTIFRECFYNCGMKFIRTLLVLLLMFIILPSEAVLADKQGAPDPKPLTARSGVTIATPNPDGSIIHIVAYGDTLYDIAQAYGVGPEEIMVNTGNSPQATDLREGERLIIRFKFTITPTNDFTPTPIPVTPQPTKTFFTLTTTATRIPNPTATLTPTPPLTHRVLGNSKNVGGVLISTGILGLLILAYFGFLRKR